MYWLLSQGNEDCKENKLVELSVLILIAIMSAFIHMVMNGMIIFLVCLISCPTKNINLFVRDVPRYLRSVIKFYLFII